MIEEWLNVLLFLSGAIKPSAISGIYLLTALFILCMILTIYQVPKFVYKFLFFISLIIVIWKSIMLSLLYDGYISELFEKERYLLGLLGVFYSEDLTWDESSSLSFIPDTLAFICSIVGWIYAKKVKFRPSDDKRKNLWLFCCFLALTGTCASYFTYVNIGYLVIWIFWAFCWSLKLSKVMFKYGVLIISLLTTLQIVFSYFFHLFLLGQIAEDNAELYGIILNKPRYLPTYILVFVLHCFSTMYIRKSGIKEERLEALREKMLQKEEEERNAPNLEGQGLPEEQKFPNEEEKQAPVLKNSKSPSESLKTDSDISSSDSELSDSSDSSSHSSAKSKDTVKKMKSSSETSEKPPKSPSETSEKPPKSPSETSEKDPNPTPDPENLVSTSENPKNQPQIPHFLHNADRKFSEAVGKYIVPSDTIRDLGLDLDPNPNPKQEPVKPKAPIKTEPNKKNMIKSLFKILKCTFLFKFLISPTLLFFLSRFLLFFWIFYFKSAFSVLIMLWLFYSIIDLDHDRMILMTRFTLIPLLALNCFITFIFQTINFDTPTIFGVFYRSFPALELLFQMLTILTFIFINRTFGYNTKVFEITTETKSVWGILYTIIQQNSDKLSLIILFLVGLSDINIFHIGFIVICLIFLFDIQLARRFWGLLMFYTMGILIVRYIWILVLPMINIDDIEILELIGLPKNSQVEQEKHSILPYDYYIWILLLSASIQNRAFGSTMFSLDYYKLTKSDFRAKHPLLVNYIVNIYEWYTLFQVWVSYFFVFLIMFLSPLNILNYIRFICFCLFMFIHLKDVNSEISLNYLRVKKIWGVTVYYSGVLLIVRYVYQFIPFMHLDIETQYSLIGIEVYKESQLYKNMVSDCMLLLFSILESRNRSDNLDRGSFEFEEVGFLTGIVRANLSLIGQEKHVITALQYLEEPFPLIVLFTVCTISVFWKLSLSMTCYLVAIGWYLFKLGDYFGEVVEHKQLYSPEIEWDRRVSVWNVLFLFTFANMILSYGEFLVTPSIFGDVLYQKVLWIYFCTGFSKTEGRTLLSVSYGYVILWVLLIIERHCVEFMLNTRVNISQEDEFRRLKNKNVTIMRTLDFLRVFAEALVPMFVLLIAFSKITFISIIYVLAVFLSIIFASPYRRTHILNMIVIFMIWLQYILILSNIQSANSPEHLPKDKKILNTPWYTRVNWRTKDDPVFLNLGTGIDQLHNAYYDLLCTLFIMIYYKFLCTKEHELFLLEMSNPDSHDKNKKMVFAYFKKIVYNLSHVIIFLFVLMFIIQNSGVISGVYCLFCLIFIYGANEVIRSERGWSRYMRTLRIYFLTFMLLDLTLNIMIQIPFGIMNISSDGWLNAIGLQRLWRAGQDSPPPDEETLHKKVTFKIFAFAFLYMMYRMMRSKDFRERMTAERANLKAQGKIYGMTLAKEFNNKRVEENIRYQEKRKRFENELKKLDLNVQKWNQKFYEEKRDSLIGTRNRANTAKRKTTIHMDSPQSNDEPSFKTKLQNWLISFINPVLFRTYLDFLKAKEKIQVAPEAENLDDEKNEVQEEFEEINFNEKQELTEYNLNWKNYFTMIILILMSNTQALVYLFCVVNHMIYASLESLVFPVSVVGYAMLEYPRPPFKYFRFVMLYTEFVFFIKFILQFQLWDFIFGNEFMQGYKDENKIGFNLASNTYSKTLFYYVFWDVVVMLFILLHEHFLLRVGLWHKTEYEMETLSEGKNRLQRGYTQLNPGFQYDENLKQDILSRISRSISDFFHRLLPRNKEEKPGRDLYTPTVLIQLLILVYIFIFFSKMDGKGLNISRSFKANQFQGRMVIALMFHIGIMILERYLYLERTSQALKLAIKRISNPNFQEQSFRSDRYLQLKLLLHIAFLANICYQVFWYFPINANYTTNGLPYCQDLYDDSKCNNFQINLALQFFFVLYFAYLMVVALQLKYGLPSFRSGSFPLMKSTSKTSKIMFQFYRGVPFLFEIRTLLDWVITMTALDLFQWLKFENLYAQLYINQCNSRSYQARVRGEPIGPVSKLSLGCCSITVVLGLILAPLILFSSLNPIVEYNRVKTMSMQMGILIDENYFSLYSASRVSDIHPITSHEWEKMHFNRLDGIESTDQNIMQMITMPTTSDSLWDITPPSYTQLCKSLNNLLINKTSSLSMHMTHTYTRKYPTSVTKISQDFYYPVKYQQASNLNSTICSSDPIPFNFPSMYIFVVWLPSSGQNMNPDVIKDEKTNNNIVMKKLEDDFGYFYWEIGVESKDAESLEGLTFFTISENYSPMTFSFSVITFYISVVGLAGRLLRMVLAGPVNFIMTEMPNPEPLINMCNGVYLSRMTGDLKREEELYYELVDIIRSPEMLKSITGRSSIKDKND